MKIITFSMIGCYASIAGEMLRAQYSRGGERVIFAKEKVLIQNDLYKHLHFTFGFLLLFLIYSSWVKSPKTALKNNQNLL